MKKESKKNRKAPPPSSRLKSFLREYLGHGAWMVLIAAIVCDVNSWGHRFVMDDGDRIANEPVIQNLIYTIKCLVHPLNPKQVAPYRPLTIFSFALNYWAAGVTPDYYHIVNRLMHILACLFLLYTLRLLMPSPSRIPIYTSLLFAVHPIQTEAVTYINGRADSMAMLFMVLTWFCFARLRLVKDAGRGSFALSLVFYFLALMSKESAFPWIGVALLTDFVFIAKKQWREFLSLLRKGGSEIYVGYLVVSAVYYFMRESAMNQVRVGSGRTFLELDNPLVFSPQTTRILTGLKVMFESILQVLWPAHFSADYSANQIALISSWKSASGLTVLLLGLATLLILIWAYRRSPVMFFGLSFFLGTYFIVSNLLVPIGTIRADRTLYMPAFGILLILGALFSMVADRFATLSMSRAVQGGFLVVLIALATRTIMRNADWKDPFTLYQSSVKTCPNSAKIHWILGINYTRRKEFDAAARELHTAISILPNFPECYGSIGELYMQQGKYLDAVGYLKTAVDKLPSLPILRADLATAYRGSGNLAAANEQNEQLLVYYDSLIRRQPRNPDHHYYKANALVYMGRLKEALREFQITLQMEPHYTPAKQSIRILESRLSSSPNSP